MRKVTINEFEFEIPGHWNELTDAQLLSIAALADAHESHAVIGLELLLQCAPFKVMDRKRKYQGGQQCFVLKHQTVETENIVIPITDLAHLVQHGFNWLFTDEFNWEAKDFTFRVTSTLTRAPFAGDKNLPFIGPKSGVVNITFDEYIVANTMLDAYRQQPTDENLNMFCATLWRQKRQGTPEELLKLGDDREEFNDFVIEHNAKLWTNIDKAYKHGIYWFYLGCMQELKKFKALQGRAEKSNEPVYIASAKLVDAISNGDVTKNAQVRKTYLYEVLIHLDRVVEQNEATEERMKSLKK